MYRRKVGAFDLAGRLGWKAFLVLRLGLPIADYSLDLATYSAIMRELDPDYASSYISPRYRKRPVPLQFSSSSASFMATLGGFPVRRIISDAEYEAAKKSRSKLKKIIKTSTEPGGVIAHLAAFQSWITQYQLEKAVGPPVAPDPTRPFAEFAARLRRSITHSGLSFEKSSAKFGVSKPALKRLLAGFEGPTPDELLYLSPFLPPAREGTESSIGNIADHPNFFTDAPYVTGDPIALRDALKRASMQQQDCAEATGISRPDISKMVRGKKLPTPDQARLLAEVLDVPVDKLLYGEKAYLPAEGLFAKIPNTVLRDAMGRAGVTPSELAAEVGISPQVCLDLLAGIRLLDREKAGLLAARLAIPITSLMTF